MVNPDIEPVIQSAMQGNREAFTEIVRRYQSFAFQLAYGILHDRMEAEDAVQESFTKAFFSIKKLKSVYAFHSWLSRIVTNICLDRIKKTTRYDSNRRYRKHSRRVSLCSSRTVRIDGSSFAARGSC